MIKYCRVGDHKVPTTEFSPSKKNKDGLVTSCRVCTNRMKAKLYQKRYSTNKKKNHRDKFQLRAFQAMYKAARLGGMGNLESFVSAICGSSDDAFDKLPAGSVERWLAGTKKG
jgi:hypothetical protein